MPSFPWPITEDELLLNRALEAVLANYHPRGEQEAALVQEAAGNLIAQAYEHGVRDEQALIHYALKRLRDGN
jgi:hypothetical protein